MKDVKVRVYTVLRGLCTNGTTLMSSHYAEVVQKPSNTGQTVRWKNQDVATIFTHFEKKKKIRCFFFVLQVLKIQEWRILIVSSTTWRTWSAVGEVKRPRRPSQSSICIFGTSRKCYRKLKIVYAQKKSHGKAPDKMSQRVFVMKWNDVGVSIYSRLNNSVCQCPIPNKINRK